ITRSGGKWELCSRENDVQHYEVQPQDGRAAGNCIMACAKCRAQIDKREELDSNHSRVLRETTRSVATGEQVMAWRMLSRLRNECWAADNLDMLYLDDERLAWAKKTGDHESDGSVELHRDANGNLLQAGDNVVLTKSLDVKGSTLNAKLGTVV